MPLKSDDLEKNLKRYQTEFEKAYHERMNAYKDERAALKDVANAQLNLGEVQKQANTIMASAISEIRSLTEHASVNKTILADNASTLSKYSSMLKQLAATMPAVTQQEKEQQKAYEAAADKLKQYSDTLKRKVKDMQIEAQTTREVTKAEQAAAKAEKEHQKELQRLAKEAYDAEHKYKSFGEVLKDTWGGLKSGGLSGGVNAFASGLTKLHPIVVAVTAALTGLYKGCKAVIETFTPFESQSAKLASVLGKTREEIQNLDESAKELARDTEYTTTQVQDLQISLAKLGFRDDEIKDATGAILAMATAMDAGLGDAATLAGSALRAWRYEASESERVASVLAIATTKSALDFDKLATSLPYVSSASAALNFSIEQTVAMMAKLADAGMANQTIGTSLRNIFTKLADSGSNLSKTFGNPKTFDEFLTALQKAAESGVDLQEALELTDKRSAAAFLTLANSANDSKDGIKALVSELTNCSDALYDMQETRLNTFEGKVKLMESAWENFKLSLADTAFIKSVITMLTNLMDTITGWLNGMKSVATYEERMTSATAQADVEFAKQKAHMEGLIKLYNDATVSESKKAEALNTLKEKFGEANVEIDNQTGKLSVNAKAWADWIEATKNSIKLMQIESKMTQTLSDQIAAQEAYDKVAKKAAAKGKSVEELSQQTGTITVGGGNAGGGTIVQQYTKEAKEAQNAIKNLQIANEALKKFEDEYKEVYDKIMADQNKVEQTTTTGGGGGGSHEDPVVAKLRFRTAEMIKLEIDYQEQRNAITEKYTSGEIETKEEYNIKMNDLEKAYLDNMHLAISERMSALGMSSEQFKELAAKDPDTLSKADAELLQVYKEGTNMLKQNIDARVKFAKQVNDAVAEELNAYASANLDLENQYLQGLIDEKSYVSQKKQLEMDHLQWLIDYYTQKTELMKADGDTDSKEYTAMLKSLTEARKALNDAKNKAAEDEANKASVARQNALADYKTTIDQTVAMYNRIPEILNAVQSNSITVFDVLDGVISNSKTTADEAVTYWSGQVDAITAKIEEAKKAGLDYTALIAQRNDAQQNLADSQANVEGFNAQSQALKGLSATYSALQNVVKNYYSYKESKLRQDLNNGKITQEEYNRQEKAMREDSANMAFAQGVLSGVLGAANAFASIRNYYVAAAAAAASIAAGFASGVSAKAAILAGGGSAPSSSATQSTASGTTQMYTIGQGADNQAIIDAINQQTSANTNSKVVLVVSDVSEALDSQQRVQVESEIS